MKSNRRTTWIPASYRVSLATLVIGFGFSPPSLAIPEGLGEIRGRVVDAQTRRPIACNIRITDSSGTLITEGAAYPEGFRSPGVFVKHLVPGVAKVRITRGPEYIAVERSLEVRAAE